ncbi:hypothetical protein [Arthrobacter sp. HMWF013]|uniref:hypothetical protein n=1 Tax=Arthrobacter sp. HMWF013 TaxID=2056849 RepID=UPI0011B29AC0|nr:hypothetical protein [Arthrobacter sp. HMWF013]
MNRLRMGAAAAITALFLASCSASDPAPSPPADGGTFETLEALKEAVTAAGLACPELVLHNDAKYSASSGSCSEDLSLAVYSNDVSLESQLDFWQPIDRGSINVGMNWTVVSPDPKLIQQKLGGTVLQTGQ